jgi:peroxiredoxin
MKSKFAVLCGLLLSLGTGCSGLFKLMGLPPNPTREAPPPGIATRALAEGATAPDFSLASTTVAAWSLKETLTSKRAVLVFYRGSWCPYCEKQLGQLQEKLGELEKRNVAVAALSVDPVPKSKELQAKLKLSYPIISDPNLEAIRAFGVEDAENGIAWPAVYVIDPGGKIAWRSLSETYKDRPLPEMLFEQLDRTQPR